MSDCNCNRCGAKCRVGVRNPEAKVIRRSATPRGLCVNCATHDWLRNTYPVNMILDRSGPSILLNEIVRRQFAEILRSGNADAKIDEINWNLIAENWELPWRHKVQLSAQNPYNPDIDGPRERDRRQEARRRATDEEAIELPMTLTSFDQLNVIEDGLGDDLKNCLLLCGDPEVEVIPLPKPATHDTYSPGRFSGCRFCGGTGCAACDGEYRRAKRTPEDG